MMMSLRPKASSTMNDQWASIKRKRVKPPALLKPLDKEKKRNEHSPPHTPQTKAPRRPSMPSRLAETFPKAPGLEKYPMGCPKHFDMLMNERVRAGAASPLPRHVLRPSCREPNSARSHCVFLAQSQRGFGNEIQPAPGEFRPQPRGRGRAPLKSGRCRAAKF